MTDNICPMFGDRCGHLSIEKTSRPCTEITKDPTTGLFKPVRASRIVVVLGEFCNDYGKFVKDMHYCPVRYSLSNSRGCADCEEHHNYLMNKFERGH